MLSHKESNKEDKANQLTHTEHRKRRAIVTRGDARRSPALACASAR